MAALRAFTNKARPWAGGWSNQLVSGKFASLGVVVGGGGCSCSDSSNSYSVPPCAVASSKNFRLFPASINLACRPCSFQPTLPPPAKSPEVFNHQLNFVQSPEVSNHQLNFVPCAKDDTGVSNSVDFALAIHNHFAAKEGKGIRLLSVKRTSVIRSGFSVYNIILDGIDDQNCVSEYQYLVLHDPLQKKKKVIHQFPDPRRESDSCPGQKPSNVMGYPSTAASYVIVPVDHEDNELIDKCVSSGIQSRSIDTRMAKQICYRKVLHASKLDTGTGTLYFILLRAVDQNDNSDTYYSINKVVKPRESVHAEFFSEPLQKYQIGLGA